MVRRPFYGQSDTKIAKMDMQAATESGRAYRDMFKSLGDIASDTLEKFREKKEEKEREDNFERMAKKLPSEVFSAFGVQSEEEKLDLIKSIKKKGPREDAMAIMSFYQKAQDAQEARDVRDLQRQQLQQSMEGQKADRLRADEEREQSQTQSQNLNRFLQTGGSELLQTDQGQGLYNRMVKSGVDPVNALKNVQAFEQRIAQSQPKPMTPKEFAEYEGTLLENRKKKLDLDQKENPKPTTNLAYTEATLNAISDAGNILERSGLPSTGFWGDKLQNIGGTNAADLRASVETIVSSIGFDKLQDMRDRSPTGGALGQVSERELAQLNASLGSLKQSQSKEQFKTNLMRVKDHYQKYYKATMAQVKAYEQGLKFETEEKAMSWYDQNFPMGGKPTPDNQTNVTTPGGFSIRKN